MREVELGDQVWAGDEWRRVCVCVLDGVTDLSQQRYRPSSILGPDLTKPISCVACLPLRAFYSYFMVVAVP